jgi:hypothetical protein
MKGEAPKNKTKVKIMWLPDGHEHKHLLYMTNNSFVEDLEILKLIDLNILTTWSDFFDKEYDDWLSGYSDLIFDLESPEISLILEHLVDLNKSQSKVEFFYWFDVDRSINEKFKWKNCPLTGEALVNLGKEYLKNNRLVAPKAPLCFPI